MRVSDRVIEIVQDLECRHQGTDLSINGRTLTGVLRDIAKRARVEEDARSSLRDALNGVAGFWRENKLDDIVEQIEREQGGRVSRMRVLSVVTEMERHVSGVEGAEDSPVARWARELREALGGDGRDHAADVSVSANDLLPQEDREAIAWVRYHGGRDEVRMELDNLRGAIAETCARLGVEHTGDLTADAQGIWRAIGRLKSLLGDSVPRAAYERRLARRQRQIDESHAALRRRLDAIARLASENDALCLERAQMRPRLMPEGMEWPVFEDGEPVRIGSDFGYGVKLDSFEVTSILFTSEGCFLEPDYSWEANDYALRVKQGERVKRPAPKVLDADGEEIELGDDLYSVEEMLKFHVSAIDRKSGRIATEAMFALDKWADPKMYTHRAPVLAADGMPLREGDTVWLNDKGLKSKLVDRGEPLKVIAFDEKGNVGVLDRDGIDKGETNPWWFDSSCLTHEHPESKCRDCQYWQKDPAANNMGVCWFFYHEYEGQDCYSARRADIGACDEFVRRAKALAERDAK